MTRCKDCGATIPPTGQRGRPRQWCEDCRPMRAQTGRAHGWEVDRVALAKACDYLGLTLPVYVKRSNGRRRLGAYHGRSIGALIHRNLIPTQSYHRITVAAVNSPEDASRTLWHELTHAAQAERDQSHGKRYRKWMRYHRANMDGSAKAHARYMRNPWEVEARYAERLHDEIGPLVVQTGPNSGWYATAKNAERIAEAAELWHGGVADEVRMLEAEEV